MLAPGALAGQELGRLQGAPPDLHVHRLPVPLLQLGFVIEQIHLRRPAVHEEKNARLGPEREVSGAGRRKRDAGGGGVGDLAEESVLVQQRRQRQAGKPGACLPQEFPTRPDAQVVLGIHRWQLFRATAFGSTASTQGLFDPARRKLIDGRMPGNRDGGNPCFVTMKNNDGAREIPSQRRAKFPLPHRAVLYPQVLCWKPREPILSDTPTYRPLGVAGYLDRGLWDSPFWAMKLGRSRGAHRANSQKPALGESAQGRLRAR